MRAAPIGATRVTLGNATEEGDAAIAFGVQVPHQFGSGLGVGKAHRVFDRVGDQVPGLDHGNTSGLEQLARRRRVAAAGENDALGAARQHGAQQALFGVHVVVGIAQQHLQAAGLDRSGQPVSRVREVGVVQRRDQRCHEA